VQNFSRISEMLRFSRWGIFSEPPVDVHQTDMTLKPETSWRLSAECHRWTATEQDRLNCRIQNAKHGNIISLRRYCQTRLLRGCHSTLIIISYVVTAASSLHMNLTLF